ncbi:hypothetical protein CF319_g5370 [Tilletia indica]|nr:hypothetical protein CF319_g5370 [Tilletia indica]
MPPLYNRTLENIRHRIAAIEVWRDGVHRAGRRRALTMHLSRNSEEEHPAWACSLIEFTFKERVAEFFEWMNEKRWREDWTSERTEPIQALLYLDVAIANGRDDLPTAHERMKDNLAAGNGKMPYACQYHSAPAWAPFPFGSPRHPEGLQLPDVEKDGSDTDDAGRTPPPEVSDDGETEQDAALVEAADVLDDDEAMQDAALRLERQPAQAEVPMEQARRRLEERLALVVPHPGGSWILDWRRSETGATMNHVPTIRSESGPSVDSVSSEEVPGKRRWNWSDSDGDGEDVEVVEGKGKGRARREDTELLEESEESEAGKGLGRGRGAGGSGRKKMRGNVETANAAQVGNADGPGGGGN